MKGSQHCTLLFLERGDQILLAMKKRGFGANRWNGVGGKVDKGETLEQALVRECQEEIDVTPTSFRKVAYLEFVNDAVDEPWHQHVHVYMCDEWKGDPTESEEMAPRWYAKDHIPYDDMWQDDKFWLPVVLAGKKVRGDFTFDEHDNVLTAAVNLVTELP